MRHPAGYGSIIRDFALKDDFSKVRDKQDFALLDAFVKADKPVFEIGRGVFVINAYFRRGITFIEDAEKCSREEGGEGKNIIVILPGGADRYLSGDLYRYDVDRTEIGE